MDETIGILCIVLFVVYPFAMAGLAHRWSRGVRDHRSRNLFMQVFAGIAAIPAALTTLGTSSAMVPSVNVVGAMVIVLCFTATGAAIGAARDRRRERDSTAK